MANTKHTTEIVMHPFGPNGRVLTAPFDGAPLSKYANTPRCEVFVIDTPRPGGVFWGQVEELCGTHAIVLESGNKRHFVEKARIYVPRPGSDLAQRAALHA